MGMASCVFSQKPVLKNALEKLFHIMPCGKMLSRLRCCTIGRKQIPKEIIIKYFGLGNQGELFFKKSGLNLFTWVSPISGRRDEDPLNTLKIISSCLRGNSFLILMLFLNNFRLYRDKFLFALQHRKKKPNQKEYKISTLSRVFMLLTFLKIIFIHILQTYSDFFVQEKALRDFFAINSLNYPRISLLVCLLSSITTEF